MRISFSFILSLLFTLNVVSGYYYYRYVTVSAFNSVLEPPCDYVQFKAQDFQGYKYKAWQFNFTIPSQCNTSDYRMSLVEQYSDDCFSFGYNQVKICDIDYVKYNNTNDVCNAVFSAGGSRTLQDVLQNDAGSYATVEYRGNTGVQVGDVTIFGQQDAVNVTTYVVFSVVCSESDGDVFLFVQSNCNTTQPAILSSVAVVGDVADDYCNDDDNLSGWEIALIVIGSILGVSLLILLVAILIDACTPSREEVKTSWVPETVPLQQPPPGTYNYVGQQPPPTYNYTGYPPPPKGTTTEEEALKRKAPISQVHTPSSDAPVPPPVVQQSTSHGNWPNTTINYPQIDDQNVQTQPKV